ncbi:Fic family protein, partial [Patescibacteria group bacterium]|nr:Fic family protein [Patescibacteria group bacterium]
MYQPKFTITNDILANIGLIEAAREVVKNAPLIPVYEARFVKDALLRTVHHATHLEGNDLSLAEAKRVIEGENILAGKREVQEVINYRNVLKYIDSLERELKENWRYHETILKKINSTVCERVVSEDQAGKYRQAQVVLKNEETDEVVFRPPAAVEVPYLIEDFFDWLNSIEGKKLHPVLRAAISHYYLVAVHSFVEGNGRTARAFATLVLFAEGYDIKKFFSLEEYFDKDTERYYQALTKADSQNQSLAKRDLTFWLEYFSQATAVELTRIKEQVKRLSLDVKIKSRVGYQIPLNERQIKLVEYLEENGSITT